MFVLVKQLPKKIISDQDTGGMPQQNVPVQELADDAISIM
jgi:hypothetical protein